VSFVVCESFVDKKENTSSKMKFEAKFFKFTCSNSQKDVTLSSCLEPNRIDRQIDLSSKNIEIIFL